MDRTRWLAISLVVVFSLILTACTAPGSAPAVQPPEASEGAAADERVVASDMAAEQVLNLVWEGGLARGPIPGLDGGPAGIGINVYMPAFIADAEGNLSPGLATHHEANENNTVFTIHIDPDATWSDGKPVTAQDFVDWWNFIFQPDLAEWTATYTFDSVLGLPEYAAGEEGVDRIEGFNALDDKTLEITLSRSEGWFPLRLAWQYSAPARVEQYIDLDFSGAETPRDRWGIMTEVWTGENCQNLIITGPYACEHMEPEPTAIYQWVRNPNWWRDEEPVITRIEGTTIRDFQTMLLMFENHEVDAALNLSGPPAVLLRQSQPEVFRQRPAYGYWAMYFDTEQEPLDDVELRRALLSSIEWDRVAEVAWEGEMTPTNAGSLLPPSMPCYDPEFQPYPFDADRARELLAQSSYGPTGADVPKIRILTEGSDPSRIRAAQIIQEMWRVNLDVEDVEIRNQESEFVEGVGLVGIHVTSGGSPVPVPPFLLRGAAHSEGTASQRWTHHVDPELDAKIDASLAMSPDDAAYCDAVQEALEMVTDAALVIPTAYINSWYQVQPWTQGFEYGLGGVYLPEVWLAER